MPSSNSIPNHPRVKNISGQRFGRLRILGFAEIRSGRTYWNCACDCGSFCVKDGGQVRIGNVMSCGCYQKEMSKKRNFKHGMSFTRIHRIWRGMNSRCSDKNNKDYSKYGARGITVCSRWKKTFLDFYHDMGEPPPKHTIDRIDNSGNYEPGNCRWATWLQQGRNRRTNKIITYRGESHCVSEWAEKLGISEVLLRQRIRKWPIEKAFTQPVALQYRRKPTN